MIELNLQPSRKARIWLGDLPILTCKPDQIIEKQVQAHIPERFDKKSVAVEISRIVSLFTIYGLLGGTYTPIPSKVLNVKIAVVDKPCVENSKMFQRPYEEVYSGLLKEFVPGISRALINSKEIISGGELFLEYALQTKLGSNNDVFQQLTTIILWLIASESVGESELAQFIQNVINNT